MNEQERAKALTIALMHKVAEIVVAPDDEKVEEAEAEAGELARNLSALTGTDPNAILFQLQELAERKRDEMDGAEGEHAAALVVVHVRSEAEFEDMVERNREQARERAADESGGEVRECEEPENKVDPGVLEGLATEVSRN